MHNYNGTGSSERVAGGEPEGVAGIVNNHDIRVSHGEAKTFGQD